MGMSKARKFDYSDGRTHQSFKDETDINKILAKYQRTHTISHLSKYQGVYGDFSDVPDLLEANSRYQRGKAIFDELPSEVRREFDNNMGAFFAFVNDPANVDKLDKVLPDLAKPGTQKPAVRRSGANMPQPEGAAPEAPETPPAPPETPAAPAATPASSTT